MVVFVFIYFVIPENIEAIIRVSKIVIPVLAVVAAYFFYEYLKNYKYLSRTTTSLISKITRGISSVEGRVIALSEVIKSPLSGMDCVYYNFLVHQEISGHQESRWKKIIDDTRFCKFGVNDGTGIAVLEILNVDADADFDIEKRKGESGLFDGADSQKRKALENYNVSSKGRILEKTLKYEERYLCEGQKFFVSGEVNEFDGYNPIFRPGINRLFISDKPRDELVKEYKNKSLIFAIAIGGLLVAEIIILIFL